MKRFFWLVLVLPLAGCAMTMYETVEVDAPSLPGVYHEVQGGQTLWHIARMYDLDIKELIKINHLPDASKIEVGQLIFIPEGAKCNLKNGAIRPNKLENFIWPAKGVVISYFGSMNNLSRNKGIDIKGREGANILASRSGKVTFSTNRLKGYGKTIIIDHLDGFQTVYAHNSSNLVSVEQEVSQGDVIAKVGTTGRADKPILHFEIRKNHEPQNPFYYLP